MPLRDSGDPSHWGPRVWGSTPFSESLISQRFYSQTGGKVCGVGGTLALPRWLLVQALGGQPAFVLAQETLWTQVRRGQAGTD